MTHYIYIPGFGDRFDPLRRLALRRWNRRGIKTTFVPMHWSDKKETYQQKYQRVAATIQQAKGQDIVVVGESAGGAMALYAYLQQSDQVQAVMTICGYMHTAEDIHTKQRRRHPAFYPLVRELDKLLARMPMAQRRRITTLYSWRDRIVASRYSHIDGAHEVRLCTPGHMLSIASILVRGPRALQRLTTEGKRE